MSMVSISLFSFNNFMVGVIFRLYGITYLNLLLDLIRETWYPVLYQCPTAFDPLRESGF